MSGDKRQTQEFRQRLRGAGLRATSPRIAVMSVLSDAEGPMSHGEVAERLDDAGYDRATIYRNLVDLTDVGIARRVDHGDHVWRFELIGPDHHDAAGGHAHFVCNSCGTVLCLPGAAVDVQSGSSAPRSLRRGDFEVQLRGVCDACGDTRAK